MKKSLYTISLLVVLSTNSYADSCSSCTRYNCGGPNKMQSCLQTCDYPNDILNCVGYNLKTAQTVCQSQQTDKKFQENCRRIKCIFQGSPTNE